MVREGHDKTFGINNSSDLLRKLKWEIQELRNAPKSDLRGLCYHAFNGVVTAWHMGDWVWAALTNAHRASLKNKYGINNRGDFLHWARETNQALAICREIATASKHFAVDQSPTEDIATVASARTEKVVDSDGAEIVTDSGGFVVAPAWVLKVDDGDGRREIIDVLEEAEVFWNKFMDVQKIAHE